jgi:hypothetical protein
MLLQAEGFYFNSKSDTQNTESSGGGFSLSPGVRWVANPEGVVEVGMAHVVYYAWGQSTTKTQGATIINASTTNGSTATTATFGTATAIVAERKLLPQLWLRVGATVLRASGSKSAVDYKMPNGGHMPSDEVQQFNIRFSFEPMLSLRLAF